MFYNFLFFQNFKKKGVSLLLLILRVVFGLLFLIHGIDKMMNFNQIVNNFPSAFGFGSYMTLMVAIFCEFCCSLFLLAGFLQRLITIPMIISMGVAFFDVHDALFPEGELSLIYFIVFIILFFLGPGRYSVDYLIDKRIRYMKFQKS